MLFIKKVTNCICLQFFFWLHCLKIAVKHIIQSMESNHNCKYNRTQQLLKGNYTNRSLHNHYSSMQIYILLLRQFTFDCICQQIALLRKHVPTIVAHTLYLLYVVFSLLHSTLPTGLSWITHDTHNKKHLTPNPSAQFCTVCTRFFGVSVKVPLLLLLWCGVLCGVNAGSSVRIALNTVL